MSKKTKDQQSKAVAQKVEDRKQLQDLLIIRADEEAAKRYADSALDREREKIELIGGGTITREWIKEIQSVIAKNIQDYAPQFPQEYYRQIFRLKGWEIPKSGYISEKPHVVATYTNEIIYDRFTKDILPSLQALNPYVAWGIRAHKHFQWLNEAGKIMLQKFIEDAITYMKKHNNWYDFRKAHAKDFGLNIQLNAFNENQD